MPGYIQRRPDEELPLSDMAAVASVAACCASCLEYRHPATVRPATGSLRVELKELAPMRRNSRRRVCGVYARGPYEKLEESYRRFFGAWLPKSVREPRDAEAFEEYLNSPMNSRPEDLLTRIHVPPAR
jgi:hypothetical protein